jgi:hypothetical protein
MSAHEGVTAVALPDSNRKSIPLLEQRRRGRVNTSAPITVAHPGNTACSEHAAHLGQRSDGLAEMHQHHMGKDGVERAIEKGQPIDICNFEADVRHSTRRTQGLRLLDLRWLKIDANHFARRHLLGKS